ncbi:extracellular solute-binding protein [Pararobbsia silviterrae]|uniref:ABC transporter substrate-binding protein n=1 Tax=Pararobbsia silviterrae TaxID=1792498 RepID=A0A494XVF8_9BURK|nr:extracellular solute-binding protein [Pararobbsia silviterrae]RKP54570.1 ABC transporter substrate-binding protein [Pararobbsia silviterrae]
MNARLRCFTSLLAVACALGAALGSPAARAVSGIAQYGAPKYAAGFTHFDYVNPDAPKGGTLTLANFGSSFDKFNPMTLRGIAAPHVGDLMFETLITNSNDEPNSAYGLLADDIRLAPDGLSVDFHLNPVARFSNGDRVTPADVRYSFEMLLSKQANPAFRVALAEVKGAEVVDASTVRFTFSKPRADLPYVVGELPVFSPKWGQRPDGSHIAFDKLAFEPPIASGPYLIDRFEPGRDISYKRDPNYWGAHLPTRRGMYNFDRIVFKLYGDDVARLEAFKAGEFDAIAENRARSWVRSYTGERFERGDIIKQAFPNHNGANIQGFYMNLRRPLFQDRRVREALNLAFDFEWADRMMFYRLYDRTESFFMNTDFQAKGMPSAAELKLLEPWRGELDASAFGPMIVQPKTTPPDSLRENLRKARALLAQAGWTYRDGALRNAAGQPFRFEMLDSGAALLEQVSSVYARNLQKLGITLVFRKTDAALYQQRLDSFDFDMTTLVMPAVQVPGSEQIERWGSKAADTPGSDNMIGIKSPAIDALADAVASAHTQGDLLAATHALDRALTSGWYIVPHWYSPNYLVAYRRELARPATLPLYYAPDGWIISTWWRGTPDAGARAASH